MNGGGEHIERMGKWKNKVSLKGNATNIVSDVLCFDQLMVCYPSFHTQLPMEAKGWGGHQGESRLFLL